MKPYKRILSLALVLVLVLGLLPASFAQAATTSATPKTVDELCELAKSGVDISDIPISEYDGLTLNNMTRTSPDYIKGSQMWMKDTGKFRAVGIDVGDIPLSNHNGMTLNDLEEQNRAMNRAIFLSDGVGIKLSPHYIDHVPEPGTVFQPSRVKLPSGESFHMEEYDAEGNLCYVRVGLVSWKRLEAPVSPEQQAVENERKRLELENTYRIKIVNDIPDISPWKLKERLERLERAIGLIPAPLWQAVDAVLAQRNRTLTVRFVNTWLNGTYTSGWYEIDLSDSAADTFLHEYGHMIQNDILDWSAFHEKWVALNGGIDYHYGKYFPSEGVYEAFVREYARKNVKEDFAETFACMLMPMFNYTSSKQWLNIDTRMRQLYGISANDGIGWVQNHPDSPLAKKLDYLRDLLCESFDLDRSIFPGPEPREYLAYPAYKAMSIDDKTFPAFACYTLKDANGNATYYIRLRDLAGQLNKTQAQFAVGWKDGVSIETGKEYTPNGSEYWTPFEEQIMPYEKTNAVTIVDGKEVALDAIVMRDDAGGGYTYYKLRDLGKALGFNVRWTAEQRVFIETDKPYDASN